MPTLFQTAIGVFAVVLGIGWAVAPIKLSRLQREYLYFWESESEIAGTRSQRIAGRISGVVMFVLGVAILSGYIP
jgi:hypothetical protein